MGRVPRETTQMAAAVICVWLSVVLLETELLGFADGLGVACEGKKGDRKDSEICFARVTRKTES